MALSVPFEGFEVLSVLNDDCVKKFAAVHGKFKDKEEDAVVILEKTAFDRSAVTEILSSDSEAKVTLQNDIYGTHLVFPKPVCNGIKTTMIYPATKKHIAKYSKHEVYMVTETADDYYSITLPHIKAENFSLQWVYNILEKKCEAERIIFEDADPENGFILLPDMKWDLKQTEQLYLIALVHRKGILSLRDLNQTHIPLLKNILHCGQAAVMEKFGVSPSKLRIYLHYQPSYYHLHVHFTHVSFDAPGSNVERAHLLSEVISNIEMVPNYYQKTQISFLVKENDSLYVKFKENNKL